MAGDERSRLHEIVDQLPEEELTVARQLLELLARGRATPPPDQPAADDDDDAEEPATSPETIAKLAQLTDAELTRLDELLEADREEVRQFWREHFGEDLPDDELI